MREKHKKHMRTNFPAYMKKTLGLLSFLLMSFTIAAQNIAVKGIVKDELGEPLIGVSIQAPNTIVGTTTNADGKYEININPTSSLTFSYIGYKTHTAKINGQTTLDVTLREDAALLDEVVVIGYGTVKKSDLVGSVTSIKADDINKFPATNVTELLRGQGAGIQVSLDPENAGPGGSSKIRVRGSRSLSSNQSPLYLVDGMIMPNIDDLNPQDIASLEVLKDASSQSIYGSRASNGVILITTKRGKEGKVSIDVNTYVGFQKIKKNFDTYSTDEFLELRYWAKRNSGIKLSEIGETPEQLIIGGVLGDDGILYNSWKNIYEGDGSYSPINWEKELLSTGVLQKHDISVRGGAEKFRYSFGFGYMDQKGIVENSGYKRGNLRSNIDYAPYKWLDLAVNLSYAKAETEDAEGDFHQAMTLTGLSPKYEKDGVTLAKYANGPGNPNPLFVNKNYKKQTDDDYLNLGVGVTLKPFERFSYKFGANLRTNEREIGNYRKLASLFNPGTGKLENFRRSNYLLENVVNYAVPFTSDMHNLQLTFIQSVEQDRRKNLALDYTGAASDDFEWNTVANANISKVTRTINQTRAVSFAARAQYNLLGKYLLTASIRRDGASVFGPGQKWANFPSAALAWRVNDELFMKDLTWLDMLKVRVSYGVVGNWAIEPYKTLGIADSKEYIFGDKLGIGFLSPDEIPNKKLKWETTGSANFGIDFSAFNGRITTTLEYYTTRTKDLLIKRTLPYASGYSIMWDNLGETKSSGFEATINGSVIRTKDLEWDLGFSISTQKNEIVKIDGAVDKDGKPVNNLTNRWFIGESINVDYGYVFNGIWQEGEDPQKNEYLPGVVKPTPGDIKLLDYNGDGKIAPDDQKITNRDPQWYATINTSLKYKGFDVSAEFYTVQGVMKRNEFMYDYDRGGSLNGKKNGIKVNYWTPENQSNEFPRPLYTGNVPNMGVLGLQKANYFRMRSATIGYTLPRSVLSKVFVESARFYVTATNLFTITDYKSYSPELDAKGYPEPQTIAFGLNLSF